MRTGQSLEADYMKNQSFDFSETLICIHNIFAIIIKLVIVFQIRFNARISIHIRGSSVGDWNEKVSMGSLFSAPSELNLE